MFPKASTLIEKITHFEFAKIINRGLEEPYTVESLYESPHEHTYQGWGREFEEHNKNLKKEGKKINFIRLITYFKKEFYFIFVVSMTCYATDFMIPLFLEKFLSWNFQKNASALSGSYILAGILAILTLRLIFEYQGTYFLRRIRILTSNTLEVRF